MEKNENNKIKLTPYIINKIIIKYKNKKMIASLEGDYSIYYYFDEEIMVIQQQKIQYSVLANSTTLLLYYCCYLYYLLQQKLKQRIVRSIL